MRLDLAQNWKSIEINYGEAKDSIIATIIGIDKNGKDQILKSATSKKIDISDINANIYPNIKINLDLFRDSLLNSANIYSIACDFEPSAEFAIIKSSTFLEKNNILKGDTNCLDLTLKNLSLRSASKPCDIDFFFD